MATSGTISKNIGTNGVYTLWIDWARNSKSDANNTSNITVTLKARRNDGYPSYGAYNNYGNNTIRLTVGGSVKVNNTAANIDLRTSTGVTLATWTGDVAHNTDGTLNLSLEGYFYFNTSAASSLPKGGYTVNGTASLDTIPRKSSVTCTDANVGSSAVITISRASSSFRHTLTYSFGSLSGTIASNTESTSVGWTLPTTFYSQMPKRTLQGTILCETFDSSGNSLGTNSCNFTATAVDNVTVSGSVVDTNSTTSALTGDSNKLIKYFSTAKATISASTNNSATIISKTINGADVTSEKIFENCEISSFIFYAKDSRDYSNSATVNPDMIQYIKLTNNASATRVTPTGDTINLSISGNFFNGSFGASNNTLTCKYRYCISGGTFGDYQTVTATKSGNSYSYSVTLSGFDYQNSYAIEVVVSDELMAVSKSITLLKGTPVFDWGENDFKFNVPAKAPSFYVINSSGEQYSIGIESRSENDGVIFTKYRDGTFIQKRVISGTWATTDWEQWGSLYCISDSARIQAEFLPGFISPPTVFASIESDYTLMLANAGYASVTKSPAYYAIRPSAPGGDVNYTITILAVGNWE